jgi:hypothetical protein
MLHDEQLLDQFANLHQSVSLYFNFEKEKFRGVHVDFVSKSANRWITSQIANSLIFKVCQSTYCIKKPGNSLIRLHIDKEVKLRTSLV